MSFKNKWIISRWSSERRTGRLLKMIIITSQREKRKRVIVQEEEKVMFKARVSQTLVHSLTQSNNNNSLCLYSKCRFRRNKKVSQKYSSNQLWNHYSKYNKLRLKVLASKYKSRVIISCVTSFSSKRTLSSNFTTSLSLPKVLCLSLSLLNFNNNNRVKLQLHLQT